MNDTSKWLAENSTGDLWYRTRSSPKGMYNGYSKQRLSETKNAWIDFYCIEVIKRYFTMSMNALHSIPLTIFFVFLFLCNKSMSKNIISNIWDCQVKNSIYWYIEMLVYISRPNLVM